MTDAFFTLDGEWRFTYLNADAERVLARRREELLGRSVWEEFPEAVELAFYREYKRAVEDQATVTFEEFYPPLESWFEVRAYPLEDGLAVYLRDINDRKRMEEEFRGSQERMRAILTQYGSDLITIVDAGGVILYESPASEQVLGYQPEGLIGTNAFDRIHPEDLEKAAGSFARILDGPGQGQPVEARFQHADGSWRYFEVLSNNLLEDPDVRGVVINSRDVTERKEAERRLAQLASFPELNPSPVLEIGSFGKLTYTNPAANRLFPDLRASGTGHPLLANYEATAARLHEGAEDFVSDEIRVGELYYQRVMSWVQREDLIHIYALDVSARKRAEETLRRRQASLYEAQRVANLGSWEYYPEEDRAEWSDQLYLIFGLSPRKAAPSYKKFLACVYPEDRRFLNRILLKSLRDKTQRNMDFRIVRADGEVRWVNAQYEIAYDDADNSNRAIGTVLDITERKLVEEEQIRLAAIVESSEDAIIGKTLEGMIVSWNPGATKLYGYTAEEVRGRNISILSPSRDLTDEISDLLERAARGESIRSRETVRVTKNGRLLDVSLTVSPIKDLSGSVTGVSTVERDITERKALEQQLEHQAVHDPLTGLSNRTLFADRLRHALALTDRWQEHVAVFFIDLDNFKLVNDTLGHAAGDQLLVEVARRLETCLRPEDTVARFGGDEFTVLLEGTRAEEAEVVAERVLEELRAPLVLANEEMSVTASIGITFGVSSLETPESLLRSADLAMYGAKAGGKSGYEMFRPIMRARAENRFRLESDLRRAVRREEFVVYYQPKVRLASGRIFGVEALVRWEHPEHGLIPLLDFIPLAEENGLIVPIGRQVMEEAFRQARVWHDRYPADPPLLMCVNLSARQFQHPEMVQDIVGIIRDTGVDPNSLDLEITESIVMKYGESNLSRLRELRDMGIKIAIDDFGTGYSSLAHLQRLPVDLLKIDRSFIDGLEARPENKALVSMITYLAHSLGLNVVAEGVETASQLAQVMELGCEMAQGYYFAKPHPAEKMDALLMHDPRW